MAVIEESDLDGVEIASTEELEQAAASALDALGLTYEQLREQARSGAFVSERARLVWLAVSDIAPSASAAGSAIR